VGTYPSGNETVATLVHTLGCVILKPSSSFGPDEAQPLPYSAYLATAPVLFFGSCASQGSKALVGLRMKQLPAWRHPTTVSWPE
jgi:hypothetical protein